MVTLVRLGQSQITCCTSLRSPISRTTWRGVHVLVFLGLTSFNVSRLSDPRSCYLVFPSSLTFLLDTSFSLNLLYRKKNYPLWFENTELNLCTHYFDISLCSFLYYYIFTPILNETPLFLPRILILPRMAPRRPYPPFQFKDMHLPPIFP